MAPWQEAEWLLAHQLPPFLSTLHTDITPVTFDPDTAHPLLTVSPSRTAVRYEEDKDVAECPANPRRFTYYYNLLGQQAFTGGRHYWEVEVAGKTAWRLGVVQDDVKRGETSNSGDSGGFWTLSLKEGGAIVACTDPDSRVARSG